MAPAPKSRSPKNAVPKNRVPPPRPVTGDGLRITARLQIPRSELLVRASRSSGAGGQHVNKTSSRIEVVWSIATSAALNDTQRERLNTRLASKLSNDGELRVVASDTRSQAQNREIAEERLAELVREALKVPKVRKPAKPSRAAKEARIESKKQQAEKKRERRWRDE